MNRRSPRTATTHKCRSRLSPTGGSPPAGRAPGAASRAETHYVSLRTKCCRCVQIVRRRCRLPRGAGGRRDASWRGLACLLVLRLAGALCCQLCAAVSRAGGRPVFLLLWRGLACLLVGALLSASSVCSCVSVLFCGFLSATFCSTTCSTISLLEKCVFFRALRASLLFARDFWCRSSQTRHEAAAAARSFHVCVQPSRAGGCTGRGIFRAGDGHLKHHITSTSASASNTPTCNDTRTQRSSA